MRKIVVLCAFIMLFSVNACNSSKKSEAKPKTTPPSSNQKKDKEPTEIDLSKKARYSIQPVTRDGETTNQLFKNREAVDIIRPSYHANCEDVTCGVSSLFLGDKFLYFLYLESGESEKENQRYSFYYYKEALDKPLHATKSDSFDLSDSRNKFEIKGGALSYTIYPLEPRSSYIYQKKGLIKFFDSIKATLSDKKQKMALTTLLDLLKKSSRQEDYDPLQYFDEDYYYYIEEVNEGYLENLPGPSFADSFFLNSYSYHEVSSDNKVTTKGEHFIEVSLVNSTEDGNTDFIISATFNEKGRIVSISQRL